MKKREAIVTALVASEDAGGFEHGYSLPDQIRHAANVDRIIRELANAGYSIVRTEDHISRTALDTYLRSCIEDEGGAYNRGIRVAIRAIAKERQ